MGKPVTSLRVKVLRYGADSGYSWCDACFVSDVYAIDGDRFLVYDDAAYTANEYLLPHFEWVDINTMVSVGDKQEMVVTLWDDEDEDDGA